MDAAPTVGVEVVRHVDPPPSPPQSWVVEGLDSAKLMSFARTAKGSRGCAVLTYAASQTELFPALASGLARLGVRHFAGVEDVPVSPNGEAIFTDSEPLSPLDLAPVPSLSVFQADRQVSRLWLRRLVTERLAQSGESLVDVLVVPAATTIGGRLVGRDIPAMQLVTALELVGRG